jgi:hypothetical protein
VYYQVKSKLGQAISSQVDESSLERLTLMVVGMIQAQSISPSQMADALAQLEFSDASEESIERRLRRIENDPELTAELCVHPFARQRLLWGHPKTIHLIIDPTCQDERIVKLTVGVWYRGRALPICWSIWPGNTPLEDQAFWDEVEKLLDQVHKILPKNVEVVVLADRAFGTPAFTDLVQARGWHFLVRVQDQTRVLHPTLAPEGEAIGTLVDPGGFRKLKGRVFKKRGWREVGVVVYWRKSCDGPLCLVSSLPPDWSLIGMYRRRYVIEATFRNYKSKGFHFEQGQVTDQAHLNVLLVGMALACWLCILTGTGVAREHLAVPASGNRRTMPRIGKRSLFHLGLKRLGKYLITSTPVVLNWHLEDWDAPCWHRQVLQHHRNAYNLQKHNTA